MCACLCVWTMGLLTVLMLPVFVDCGFSVVVNVYQIHLYSRVFPRQRGIAHYFLWYARCDIFACLYDFLPVPHSGRYLVCLFFPIFACECMGRWVCISAVRHLGKYFYHEFNQRWNVHHSNFILKPKKMYKILKLERCFSFMFFSSTLAIR